MPIRPENKHRYPHNWKQIRAAILERAGHRCEQCGLPNHAVGYRAQDGSFVPLRGNAPCDAAGDGKSWPSYGPISYADSHEFTEQYNNHAGNRDAAGRHWFVIVLTIAHLDHTPENNDPANLRAFCQRCHLAYDAEHHTQTAYRTRRARESAGDLFAHG